MSQLRTGREKTPKKGKQVLEGSRKNDDQLAKLGIPKIPLVKKQSKSKVFAAVKPAGAALSFRTANAASTSKLVPSKPNAGASSVTKDSAAGEPLAEKCAVCEQIVVEGKDEALYCEGICQRWLHKYCAGVTSAQYAAMSSTPDPFLCVGCFYTKQTDELTKLKSIINTLQDEVMQLRSGLEKKDAAPFHLNTFGVCRQDGEQSSWGRDRGRGGRGRRGRGGMGGHGKWRAGAGGNCGIPEECTSDNGSDNDGGQSGDGIGRGGSGRGGDGGGGALVGVVVVGVSGVVVVTVATTSFGRVIKGIPLPNMQDNPVTEF